MSTSPATALVQSMLLWSNLRYTTVCQTNLNSDKCPLQPHLTRMWFSSQVSFTAIHIKKTLKCTLHIDAAGYNWKIKSRYEPTIMKVPKPFLSYLTSIIDWRVVATKFVQLSSHTLYKASKSLVFKHQSISRQGFCESCCLYRNIGNTASAAGQPIIHFAFYLFWANIYHDNQLR